jgi:hypothetical protein
MPSTQQFEPGRAAKGQSRDQPQAASYPLFNARIYSIDTLLPVLEFGQNCFAKGRAR